jgi:hypothetical protein
VIDLVVAAELGVINAVAVYAAWRASPAQRSRRRRDSARARIELRRAFRCDTTDPADSPTAARRRPAHEWRRP